MTGDSQMLVIDPKTTRINLGILGTVLMVAVAGAFYLAGIESTVDRMDRTLEEVRAESKHLRETIVSYMLTVNGLETREAERLKRLTEVDKQLTELKARIRRLEDEK